MAAKKGPQAGFSGSGAGNGLASLRTNYPSNQVDRKQVSSETRAEDNLGHPSNHGPEAIIQLLAARWPRCFPPRGSGAQPRARRGKLDPEVVWRPLPLKKGIHLDILDALNGVVSEQDLSNALGHYVRDKSYLRALTCPGAKRINLEGNPTIAVTWGESEYAYYLLMEWRPYALVVVGVVK
jgi:ProQ/FINO family